MKDPKLRELDERAFLRRLNPILRVYAAAMRPPEDQLPGRNTIMARHARHPRFRALVAEEPARLPGRAGRIAGFCYGFRGCGGQWWHDVVYRELERLGGPEHADRWMADSFEVAELHVRPDAQGRGLGRALLTAACEGREEATVVLSTLDLDPESPARRLYRSVGLTDLFTGFAFPGGGPPYAVMGGALPLAAYRPASSSS
ncbi:GNAT family N-acetyltransferase [Actinomadura atramentaria]|uniref:GNAT family N-acetyltransferase n=1 Tax=Actinomadura atramentaria TaxID=1990 RepID=UPI000365BAAB|nr:GNAT family N-acetyltransferase [Actinomadura atramentaria]